MIFNKHAKTIQWKKNSFSRNGAAKTRCPQQKNKVGHLPNTVLKS